MKYFLLENRKPNLFKNYDKLQNQMVPLNILLVIQNSAANRIVLQFFNISEFSFLKNYSKNTEESQLLKTYFCR